MVLSRSRRDPYFSDFDYWGHKDSVNDHNVGGHELLKTFPLDKARQPSPYNWPEERNLAYHNFDKRDEKVTIGPNLFGKNALGIRTASDFARDMHRELTPAELESCCWADVYFYKDDGLKDAETLTQRTWRNASISASLTFSSPFAIRGVFFGRSEKAWRWGPTGRHSSVARRSASEVILSI